MDADIAYAKEYNLKPGIALTKEQMAALTSDMGWLESTTVTVNGKTYDVLYPHVYLKAGSEKKIAADGSLISANQLVMEAKNQLANSGALMGKLHPHAGERHREPRYDLRRYRAAESLS